MATVRGLLLAAADLPGESARRDAEILLCHALGQTRSWLYTWPECEPPAPQQALYMQLLQQRRAGRPVAHLLGTREFWSLALTVTADTLIPRPETETLVSWALDLVLPPTATVLDLGTGCGAIALALSQERAAWEITAVDNSESALAVARRNGARLGLIGVDFLHSDWYGELGSAKFDLIVSNPPYIDPADAHLERGDLRFEPRAALVAGAGGLAALAAISAGVNKRLHDGGYVLLEHGYDQGPAVRQLLTEQGLRQVATRCDLAGHERITGGKWHA